MRSSSIFDLEDAIRRVKPQRRTSIIQRRPNGDLPWSDHQPLIGGPLLLDTTVYIDVLQGRSPASVDHLLDHRICHHSSVCIAELTHAFGRLNPAHPQTRSSLATIKDIIGMVPPHRCHAPTAQEWVEAGMLAGMMFRLSGRPVHQGHERKLLNDALLFLQAARLGCPVLTGNLLDFDTLNQLVPRGRIMLYRCAR